MKLTRTDDPLRLLTTFTLEISMRDQATARPFDGVDQALLVDCARPGATVADALLALELIARRIEEGYSGQKAKAAESQAREN